MLEIDKMILSEMKDKNDVKLKVFRAIKAEILNFKTAKNAKPYNEVTEIQLLKKMCKQRKDSISEYSKAGREDLVQSESLELEELEKLLPSPASASEIESALCMFGEINGFFDESGRLKIPKKEIGKTIKWLQSEFPANDSSEMMTLIKRNLKS